jgi:hypothetical protein
MITTGDVGWTRIPAIVLRQYIDSRLYTVHIVQLVQENVSVVFVVVQLQCNN